MHKVRSIPEGMKDFVLTSRITKIISRQQITEKAVITPTMGKLRLRAKQQSKRTELTMAAISEILA